MRLDRILTPIARRYAGTAPPGPPDLGDQLKQIQALSQNARATWFGLIALNLFVGVTLLAHRDADFFARDAATKLPILNIEVPVVAFFLAAPLLVTAIHVYLQIYLVAMWRALGAVPARDGAAPVADRVFPWLMSDAALRLRTRLRPDEIPPAAAPRPMGWLAEWASAGLGWFLPILMLAGLWLRSAPLHNPWLTGWIAACLLFSALVAAAGYLAMRRALAGTADQASPTAWLFVCGTVAFGFLTCTTLEITWATNGLRWPDRSAGRPGPVRHWLPNHAAIVALLPGRARLNEVSLTVRPKDWKPFELWLADERRARQGSDDRWADPTTGQMIPNHHEMERWRLRIAALDAPSIKDRDLRDANARAAFLPGADLRGVDLSGADLKSARLEGADLSCAGERIHFDPDLGPTAVRTRCSRLIGARLGLARMEGANLSDARMAGADLGQARMDGANLRGARMEGATLTDARMKGANFSLARLEGADLGGAQMQGANLGGARLIGAKLAWAGMEGADLSKATLEGANLFGARMDRADLSDARMAGADLSEARMVGADLAWARLEGARLFGAQMAGANLTLARMTGADLGWAQMERANLSFARMEGADLRRAWLINADCENTMILAALVHATDLSCRNLDRQHLQLSVGDATTRLPGGLTVWSCLDRNTLSQATIERIDEILQFHPQHSDDPGRVTRADFTDALFCDPAAADPYRRRPVPVGQQNAMPPH